jgi:hypothetical protein
VQGFARLGGLFGGLLPGVGDFRGLITHIDTTHALSSSGSSDIGVMGLEWLFLWIVRRGRVRDNDAPGLESLCNVHDVARAVFRDNLRRILAASRGGALKCND